MRRHFVHRWRKAGTSRVASLDRKDRFWIMQFYKCVRGGGSCPARKQKNRRMR